MESRPLEDSGQTAAEPSDAALVARARAGDLGAYEQLVRRYQQPAFRTAYLVLGGPDEAEDVTQEAFIKAYHALPRFRADAPFRPWLLQIVANEARNARRSAGRRVHLALRAQAAPDGGPRPGDAAASPEAAVLAEEQRRVLVDAVGELRDEDRLVIAYRYFLDLSEADMADALGCARGTVKSRLSRALGRLRERLGKAGRGLPPRLEVGHG